MLTARKFVERVSGGYGRQRAATYRFDRRRQNPSCCGSPAKSAHPGTWREGSFCDYRELLKRIQNSYDPQVQTTELELMQPVFAAEVLVLDDPQARRRGERVGVGYGRTHPEHTRYNDKLTTIITTNYPDLAAGGGAQTEAERAAREQTLGDRLGARMRSRLAEMCVRVEMMGNDFKAIGEASPIRLVFQHGTLWAVSFYRLGLLARQSAVSCIYCRLATAEFSVQSTFSNGRRGQVR